MSSIPGYLPVFTAASTSPPVPADSPHCHWRTGWFVVWSRRCRVHCCTCHRSSMPTSSAIHPCPWSAYYLFHRWQLLLLVGFGDTILCCRSLVGLFAVPAFIPFSMASHRSSIQLCLVDLIFFLTSLCNAGTDPCFIIWVSHPFSSRFTSHTSKVSFIIQIWIFSVSS